MLRCNKVCFSYSTKNIVHDLCFTLPSAQHLVIFGDSGSGKSTLLALLTGLVQPSQGCITYNDQDITTWNEAERDYFRGQHIGMVFQHLHLIPILTTLENISLALRITNKLYISEHVEAVLQRLDILHLAHVPTHQLSMGEKQRVAIARALITQPKWIFCDEPTSSLDDKNAEATLSLLEAEASYNQASLITITHDARVKTRFAHHQHLVLGDVI